MRTAAGRDFQARVMSDPASDGTGDYAPASWIGLTSDGTTPDDADTVLTGEITSGTLARAQGIFAHTAGASSYTLTKAFTSDQVVVIRKAAVFQASSGGPPLFVDLFSDGPASTNPGDTLQVTETISL